AADQNKVNPEGQTSSIPFFVYDNQSSSSTDLNISLDLNASLPDTLKLKVATTYGGWNWTCSGDTSANCLLIGTATDLNIGKATYTAGTKDLNIFIWADFISALVGSTDRNVTSTSRQAT
ncbi:MAG: hypothetical protein Q7K42_00155, partial [Candidatus Diapherotrites archaeon]|nr:hypothetical protein [Candidatus Diapherotrites archaeon]